MMSIKLRVGFPSVPPQLAPTAFMGGNKAGIRAQAMCLVLAGDPPITLRWFKDGRELPRGGEDDIRITQSSDFSSSIAIEHTLGIHAGNYTCTATNSARSASVSAMLVVNGKKTEYGLTQFLGF